jgi:phosphohistidine phosphatase
MNRELWLLRHGKAERYDGSEDYDRRLKKRGKRDAKHIGNWMEEKQLLPESVISSPAIRAVMTANIVCDALGIARDQIQMEKRLYDEGLARVKAVLADCLATLNRVLLVGHNPEFEELLTYLVKPTELPDVEKLLPTATLVRLTLPDDWTKLEQGCAKLLDVTNPKFLSEKIEE